MKQIDDEGARRVTYVGGDRHVLDGRLILRKKRLGIRLPFCHILPAVSPSANKPTGLLRLHFKQGTAAGDLAWIVRVDEPRRHHQILGSTCENQPTLQIVGTRQLRRSRFVGDGEDHVQIVLMELDPRDWVFGGSHVFEL